MKSLARRSSLPKINDRHLRLDDENLDLDLKKTIDHSTSRNIAQHHREFKRANVEDLRQEFRNGIDYYKQFRAISALEAK